MNQDSHNLCEIRPVDNGSDRLDSLAADSCSSLELELRLAADPTTAPSHLKTLGETDDRRILEAIAGNPNAPTELLLELGAEFPEQLLNNPIFPLLCLEELHQVDKIPLKTLCSLLKQPNVPEHFFELGVKSQYWEAIGWVGMNPHTPKAMLERLVQTIRNSEFQEVAKLHVNWEGEISEGWEEIALQELDSLFQRYKSGVIQELKQLYAIAQIGPESLPDCVIEQQAIAADSETPRRLLESLSCSEHFEIRLAVAANPSTPSETLAQLAQEQQDWIHQAIAENPNTTPAVLTQLATDSEQSVAVLKAIANHPETPLPILKHLVSSKYPSVTQAAIESLYWESNLDPQWKALYQLLFESSSNLPSHRTSKLEKMAVHPDSKIRVKLADNPKTPLYILSKLAQDPDIEVRLGLVNNPTTPWTLLGDLICQELGDPPTTDSELESNSLLGEILKAYNEDWIQIEIAGNPNAPSRLLRRLATHSDPMIRRKVAVNPHTPPHCLLNLAQDEDLDVRRTVYQNPHTPFRALKLCLLKMIDAPPNCQKRYARHNTFLSTKELPKFLAIARRYLTRFPEGFPFVLNCCLKPAVPPMLRSWALCYPELRATAFHNYIPSALWRDRYCIAQHPNTPTSILERLAQDGNRIVRAAAKARLQGHPGQNLHLWIMKWKEKFSHNA